MMDSKALDALKARNEQYKVVDEDGLYIPITCESYSSTASSAIQTTDQFTVLRHNTRIVF